MCAVGWPSQSVVTIYSLNNDNGHHSEQSGFPVPLRSTMLAASKGYVFVKKSRKVVVYHSETGEIGRTLGHLDDSGNDIVTSQRGHEFFLATRSREGESIIQAF